MVSNIEFEAKVAIGLHGNAVLRYREWPAPGYVLDNDEQTNCIKRDIEDLGVDDWLDYLPGKPTNPGIYHVNGKACFTAEEGQYDEVIFMVLRDA